MNWEIRLNDPMIPRLEDVHPAAHVHLLGCGAETNVETLLRIFRAAMHHTWQMDDYDGHHRDNRRQD
jgi:hypothetical protein